MSDSNLQANMKSNPRIEPNLIHCACPLYPCSNPFPISLNLVSGENGSSMFLKLHAQSDWKKKGNKKSKYVVQWALNKFVPEVMIIFKLIHVHAGIVGVPTSIIDIFVGICVSANVSLLLPCGWFTRCSNYVWFWKGWGLFSSAFYLSLGKSAVGSSAGFLSWQQIGSLHVTGTPCDRDFDAELELFLSLSTFSLLLLVDKYEEPANDGTGIAFYGVLLFSRMKRIKPKTT
ncbi:transmembrane protein, putative [Medicago truncatula]|uniref:Transmembrane protein, putative n=1 Tax=Medicago truncatula TaxID=3880 RepID=G7JUN3_MEDTR|nr:transmembrane protein, putative [Medicago truncatula]